MAEFEIGVVTHYFGHVSVAAISLTLGDLAVGDTIRVKGHTSDFTMLVESVQMEHEQLNVARKGQNVGIRVPARAHEHDKVFKVTA